MKNTVWVISVIVSLLASSIGHAGAVASSGEGGSITIQALDPVTRKPIPDGLLRPGMQVILEVHAFDAAGNSIPCGTPSFDAAQGVTGNQIGGFSEAADGSTLMTMGDGFGSAEVMAQCSNLPNVNAKMPVVNNTLKSPSNEQPPADADALAKESNAGQVLLGVAIAAAVTVAVVGIVVASEASPCTAPELWCRSADVCCPAGFNYYCTTPSAKVGCYSDVFIDGCGEKIFCTSEY